VTGQSVIQDLKVRYSANSLPHGWGRAKLGELCDTTSGGTPPRKIEAYFKGNIPWVKSGELPDGPVIDIEEFITNEAIDNSSAKIFPAGTLLIALYGATVGKLGILTRSAATNQAVCAIFPRTALNPKYLFWYLQLARPELVRKAIGGAQPNISQAILRGLEVRVAPLNEQLKIVAEIEKQFSSLDEAVASLKRTKANLKRYKAAVLKAAVEGTLVPIMNRQTTKIGEVADLVTKGSSPNWQGFNYTERGVVFVRSQNVGWGNLDLSDVAHLPLSFNEKERKSVLRTGDVLLNIVGASIGRAAVATAEIEGGNVNQAVAVIRLNQERMLPKFLMLNLLSPVTQAAIHAEKVDVARANVSLSDIKEFSVLFPSLAEQGSIVGEVERCLSVIDELEAIVDTNLTRADSLHQSILQKAFEGKLSKQSKHTMPREN
jgi:type I restriction enzyme, S subunit